MGVFAYSLFSDFDISLFISGKHFRLYENLGAHFIEVMQLRELISPFGHPMHNM